METTILYRVTLIIVNLGVKMERPWKIEWEVGLHLGLYKVFPFLSVP